MTRKDMYEHAQDICPYPDEHELMRELMEVQFLVIELHLYLDTHPNDMEALRLYNEAAMFLHRLMQHYQREYGMLMAHTPDGREEWQWIDSPWPWEIDYKKL